MGMKRRCPDGFFEVALAGRRCRGKERCGGTMHFARCGCPGRCWPSRRGCQTMARWDYSAALLFQLATWTTLQFRQLHVAVMIALLFLKRALHSTLPPAAMAAIAHVFEEYCGGGGGGARTSRPWRRRGVDNGGLLLHRWRWGWTKVPRHCCAMVVAARLMIVPLDRRLSLACSRMARMEAVRTDGGGSGGGRAMAWHYWPFLCLLVRQRVGGGADNSALADIRDQWRAKGEILGEDLTA